MKHLALLIGLFAASAAQAADTTPFSRMGPKWRLPATTTPTQYQIVKPAGASSYRFVNRCGVDVVITTVQSMTETVTDDTGTEFLARTAEILASSDTQTGPRIVSIKTLDPPAGPCVPSMQYGGGQ